MYRDVGNAFHIDADVDDDNVVNFADVDVDNVDIDAHIDAVHIDNVVDNKVTV